ncbi:DUF7549 family protein [Haloarchaeobius sp. HRN-SO-5]|uniref:DUF7549 family protein n=1 Tax=Haloarchaeobius sp. HRN-SO-5 TaxID=3446118 RepID=UPI003EBF196D
MVWINSDYVEEFAVLTTWLSVLLPWSVVQGNISVLDGGGKETEVVILRFPLFGIRYVFGSGVFDGTTVQTPYGFFQGTSASAAAGAASQSAAHLAWTVAAVAFLAMFVLSLAMYLEVDVLRALPGRGVYVVGALMLVLAVTYTVAALVLNAHQATKILGLDLFVPVGLLGTLFFYLFGGLTLFADRT